MKPPPPGHSSLRETSTETLGAAVKADSAATVAVGGTVSACAHLHTESVEIDFAARLRSGLVAGCVT